MSDYDIYSLLNEFPGGVILADLEKAKEDKFLIINKGINIKWAYNLYLKLLYLSLPSAQSEWQMQSKIFLYYIYSFINANSVFLKELRLIVGSSKYIEYLKNTKTSWEWDYNRLLNDIDGCYIRYRIYEADFKKIFEIPLQEQNINEIGKKLPTFEYMTSDQVDRIMKYIVFPIFKGKFFNEPGKFIITQCSYDDNYNPTNCKLYSVDKYPFPTFDKDTGLATPDSIQTLALYNAANSMRKLGEDLWWSLSGHLSRSISFFTGVNKDYVGNTTQGVIDAVNDIKEWSAEKQRQLEQIAQDIKEGVTNFPSNLKKTSTDFATYAIIGGIVIFGLYFAYNEMNS